MTTTATKTPGLALICDREGVITHVLGDELGLEQFAPGRLLSASVDRESLGKTLNFLLELKAYGAAFDWQLNVAVRGHVRPLNFIGSTVNGQLLIVAAQTHQEVLELYAELFQITNEQTNEIRRLKKAFAQIDASHEAPGDPAPNYYDELTHLYNELSNVQRELAKKNTALEQLNEQKNRFLGMAAHDLRNPLNAILMYSDFLIDEATTLNAEQRGFLTAIRTSSNFMLHLVEDFLDLTTIESGKLHLELMPVDVLALLKQNLAINSLFAAKKQIRVELCVVTEPPVMLLDAGKIEQVLNNLISNTVKYAFPDTLITIRVTMPDAQQMLLAVHDQGQGIPAAELTNLFELFGRTSVKSTGGEKSSGLGLAIARKIVQAHGGRLWAESTMGQGSTFYVALPLTN